MKSREIEAAHARAGSDSAQRLRHLQALAAAAQRRQLEQGATASAQDGCIEAAPAPAMPIGGAGAPQLEAIGAAAVPPRPEPIGAASGPAAVPGAGHERDGALALGWLLNSGEDMVDNCIAGSGDRAHPHALKLGRPASPLRQTPPGRAPALPALRPSSRADCQRRCGTAGFCDPASEFGCGGEFCASRYEAL